MAADPEAPTVEDLVEAIGGLAAMLTRHIEKTGVITMAEMAGHLAVFATVTHESSPQAGAILAYWSSFLQDVARDDPKPAIDQ